jgi:glutathione S-transferase
MKLYDAQWAPSPRRVRVFLAEKGIEIERVAVDLRGGAHQGADYLAINPRGTVPALELDDGEVICDSNAICRYLEALHPEPALFGATPLEIARVEGWTRRIEAEGYAAAVYALRNTNPAFAGKAMSGRLGNVPQIAELAERAGVMWAGFVEMLNARLAETQWVAGDRFSYADIMALTTIDFARAGKLVVPDGAAHLRRWHDAASARPSAGA